MKQALISAVVAAIVAGIALQVGSPGGGDVNRLAEELVESETMVNAFKPIVLNFTMDDVDDSIVNGAQYTGVYSKLLVDAENSVCYLTKVQFKAMQGPEDSNICSIELDEFTRHWQVTATVEEGGISEARCNASCLVWE